MALHRMKWVGLAGLLRLILPAKRHVSVGDLYEPMVGDRRFLLTAQSEPARDYPSQRRILPGRFRLSSNVIRPERQRNASSDKRSSDFARFA